MLGLTWSTSQKRDHGPSAQCLPRLFPKRLSVGMLSVLGGVRPRAGGNIAMETLIGALMPGAISEGMTRDSTYVIVVSDGAEMFSSD